MKRLFVIPGLSVVLLLGGCLPSFGTEKEEFIQENEESIEETVMIPDIQLKDEYYRILQPFKKSASRGLVIPNIYTKYDMKEAEEGLLRLSVPNFAPKTHLFQEGQYIDKEMTGAWLSRSSVNKAGLNPPIKKGMTDEQIVAKAPLYLAHIVEQNYLVKTDKNKVQLSGISIGLALNSIYYTKSGQKAEISGKVIEQQGMKMAEEIVSRLRKQEGLGEVPIVVGLFKQASRNSIVPGTYFATAVAGKGQVALTGWKEVNEKYVVFPASSDTDTDNYRDINTKFNNFKQDIDQYFPSFVNVIGTGFYKEDNLKSLKIEVPIQFFGTSEIIGFTQYMTSRVLKYFPDIHTEVSITSVNGPEALIVNEAKSNDPYVHIYGY
ncbi:CamS family sex pheromone protein [Sporosarcina limicola]|uniref:Protein involved in sex pheromone biosynthesis n=1 Tax=Sporosarcina limicola TaxID=34101 RepID=A0A927MLB4_9BACL|nr:CamS family sex pheromone protein [Sporosarcina limicola]MBE1556026.1 protein involved in sex pheromone biosynthesis [Sporosarcina limicola]